MRDPLLSGECTIRWLIPFSQLPAFCRETFVLASSRTKPPATTTTETLIGYGVLGSHCKSTTRRYLRRVFVLRTCDPVPGVIDGVDPRTVLTGVRGRRVDNMA